jgi:hypothetical protein
VLRRADACIVLAIGTIGLGIVPRRAMA